MLRKPAPARSRTATDRPRSRPWRPALSRTPPIRGPSAAEARHRPRWRTGSRLGPTMLPEQRSSLAPLARPAGGWTEIAWRQAGMEPGHEAVDAEHRQSQMLGNCARIRHHVGAFEQDRADIGMRCDECVAGVEDVPLGGSGIEPLLVIDDRAAELAAVIGTDHRRVRVGTGGNQLLSRQAA